MKPAPPASPVKSAVSSRPEVETAAAAGDLRMTRKTIPQINTGTLFFKLGQVSHFGKHLFSEGDLNTEHSRTKLLAKSVVVRFSNGFQKPDHLASG